MPNLTTNPTPQQTIQAIGFNAAKSFFTWRFVDPTDSSSDLLDPLGHQALTTFAPAVVRVEIPLKVWVDSPTDGILVQWVAQCRTILASGAKLIGSIWQFPNDCCATRGQGDPTGIHNARFPTQNIGYQPSQLALISRQIVDFLAWTKLQGIGFFAVSMNEPNIGDFTQVSAPDYAAIVKSVNAATGQMWLAGDVNAPAEVAGYLPAIVNDPAARAACVGISAHSWWYDSDAASYQAAGAYARSVGLPLLVTEWGADVQNKMDKSGQAYAIALAVIGVKALALSGATMLLHWQCQLGDTCSPGRSDDNGKSVSALYPSWAVIRQFAQTFPPGTAIKSVASDTPTLFAVAGTQPGGQDVMLVVNQDVSAVTANGVTYPPQSVTTNAVPATSAPVTVTSLPIPVAPPSVPPAAASTLASDVQQLLKDKARLAADEAVVAGDELRLKADVG